MEASKVGEKRKRSSEVVRSVVSFQAKTETEVIVLDDGYKWRKYGQKDILGRKFARSYYRCINRYTGGCTATKQVQRLTKDEGVVVTIYRGLHSHSKPAEGVAETNNPGPHPHSESPEVLILPNLEVNENAQSSFSKHIFSI